jgi:hypothetical protein
MFPRIGSVADGIFSLPISRPNQKDSAGGLSPRRRIFPKGAGRGRNGFEYNRFGARAVPVGNPPMRAVLVHCSIESGLTLFQ